MSSASRPPKYLAVLPARGGSKRVPRKNVRDFHGVPLIARTIRTVLASEVFKDVVVSTDDAEIAEVAREHGAWVPFVRPASLSDDSTPTAPVIGHALDELGRTSGPYDAVCCVYPGAVLMRTSDFSASSLLVQEASARDAVVAAVLRYGHPVQRGLRSWMDGTLVPTDPEAICQRTQDLEPTWHDAGQFYWATPGRWRARSPLLSIVVPYEVPAWRVVDIDTEDDFIRAEAVYPLLDRIDAAGSAVKHQLG